MTDKCVLISACGGGISDQPEGDQTDLNKDVSLSVPESLNNPQELQAQTSTNNDQVSSESQKETELSSLSEKDNYEFSPFIQTVIYLLDVNVAKVQINESMNNNNYMYVNQSTHYMYTANVSVQQ